MTRAPLAGIFVGGKSTRMGGQPKGLLLAPDTREPLVVRLVRIAREVGLEPVLVGDASAYRGVLPEALALVDARDVPGPLAGLSALLDAADDRSAIALACDLPFLQAPLLERLIERKSAAHVVAPRAAGGAPWEPLLARYDAARVRPVLQRAIAEGVRSFQALFARLTIDELSIDALERPQLRDWDQPEDRESGP